MSAGRSLGLGDEQHDFGYEGELDPWLGLLIQRLRKEASHLFRCDSEEKELAPTHDGFWLPPPLYAAKLLGTSARKPLVSVQRSEEALVDQSVLPLIHRILLLRSPPERQNGHSVVFAQVVKSRRISASGHFQRIYFLQVRIQGPSGARLGCGSCLGGAGQVMFHFSTSLHACS